MKESFNWDKNIFEYVLGYNAVEWKELNDFINNRGDLE